MAHREPVLLKVPETVLRCVDLTKSYGDKTVVSGVCLRVEPGRAYGLLGPNGAGKSTMIAMMVGLVQPDSGAVFIGDIDMAHDPKRAKKRIGYVPQEIALYPELSARENLRFFGRLYGLGRVRLRSRIDEVLDLVGLTDRADDRIDTYSGGMKRRINIGAGLLHEPDLLVLDEPTVGVDPQSRAAILTGIENLLTTGISLVYTSHYMEEVERICDRMAIVDKGRLIAEGTKSELVAKVGEDDKVELSLDGDADTAATRMAGIEGVHNLSRGTNGSVAFLVPQGRHVLPALLAAIGDCASIVSLDVTQPDLEDTFLHLTGNSLRD